MNISIGIKLQVLAQIGLIDTKSLPIMGIEQARKLSELSRRNIQAGI